MGQDSLGSGWSSPGQSEGLTCEGWGLERGIPRASGGRVLQLPAPTQGRVGGWALQAGGSDLWSGDPAKPRLG